MDKRNILPSLIAIAMSSTASAGFYNDKPYYSLNLEESKSNNISPFVVDGTETDISNFPYYARVVESDFTSSYRDFCGASVLDELHILTAAHCVDAITENTISNIAVIINNGKAGDGDVSLDELMAIESVHMHEGYNSSTLVNDIAVIKLKTAMTDFTPIKIYLDNEVSQYNKADTFTVVGLGNTNVVRPTDPICSDENADRDQNWINTCLADSDTPSDVLLSAELNNIGDDRCNTEVSGYYGGSFTASKQACALPIELEGKITASCNGDSGGPLTFMSDSSYKQFALVSYGSSLGCDETDAPQVFTEIAGYKEWLSKFIDIDGYSGSDEDVSDPSFGDNGNFTSGNGDGGSTGLLSLFGLIGLASLRRKKQ